MLVFGQLPTGAADDLVKATNIAHDMATRYGMVETLGHVAHEPQHPAFLDVPGLAQNGWQPGPETRQRIDEAVRSTGCRPSNRPPNCCRTGVRCWSVAPVRC